MAAVINTELDPVFLKALGYLHSKSKDSAERLKALLDESLCKGMDSGYRPPQKDIEQSKVTLPKPKQDVKPNSSTSGSILKPLPTEKVKKEAEKRSLDKMKGDVSDPVELPKKPRLEKPEARSSPITVPNSKDMPDLSSFDETSADDFAMEMGLACVVCRQMTVFSGNQLVECQECHNLYHQDCHKPQVTDKDVNDPRLVWYCARCTRQMKRMAQKNQKPPQKSSPSSASATLLVVKDPSVSKPEMKPKADSTNTFLAFKRAEVKASSAASGNSSNSGTSSSAASGLSGWAAFGAKTASAAIASSKLGNTTQAAAPAAGKPPALSAGQKPMGSSSLTPVKTGSASKPGSGSSSTNPALLKPLPPLILGKTGLSRTMSNENVSKTGLPSPSVSSSGSSISSQLSSGNGGSSSAGSSGSSASKAPVDPSSQQSGAKGPTSQESQLNAMKRLQMVKKKAAQKKLKK